MEDDVIKNPYRVTPKTQIPYEPEYVRKNINVPIAPATLIPSQDSFMGIDGDIDGNEIPFENGHVIDNNDYVNLGYSSMPSKQNKNPIKPENSEPLKENTTSPGIGDYILMVYGKLILSGTMEKIESKVKDIMYGDDPDFPALEVSMDDIVVLKRVAIKIGIFIDR